MTIWLLLPILAPLAAAALVAAFDWRRATATAVIASAATILASGLVLWHRTGPRPRFGLGGLLRVDALSVTMLLVIGAVGTLSAVASIGYLDADAGHLRPHAARRYGVLMAVFLAAMSLAVQANNIGVTWVAIEATTVVTAFLVGHHGTRAALEATWKYVIICSVGIALAFLGVVLLYFAAQQAGAGSNALDLDVLRVHAAHLDRGVTRLAAGLLLLGFGAKAGLAPFHTWLADAHSQAPGPVSALMSGVLLAVAFTTVLRLKAIIDVTLGTGFLRTGLLGVGLLTVFVAAALLVNQRDYKRMLAYSSMENMGLLAIAAAAGTPLAIAALLLHVVGHGLTKTALFIAAGHVQASTGSTAIDRSAGLLSRSGLIGAAFAAGIVGLLGFPPFALFASEVSMARAITNAGLAWAFAATAVMLLVAFAALAQCTSRLVLGNPAPDAGRLSVPVSVGSALVVGLAAAAVLGVTAGPLVHLLRTAAATVGAV
jgi:hydrogenase-4 component F